MPLRPSRYFFSSSASLAKSSLRVSSFFWNLIEELVQLLGQLVDLLQVLVQRLLLQLFGQGAVGLQLLGGDGQPLEGLAVHHRRRRRGEAQDRHEGQAGQQQPGRQQVPRPAVGSRAPGRDLWQVPEGLLNLRAHEVAAIGALLAELQRGADPVVEGVGAVDLLGHRQLRDPGQGGGETHQKRQPQRNRGGDAKGRRAHQPRLEQVDQHGGRQEPQHQPGDRDLHEALHAQAAAGLADGAL